MASKFHFFSYGIVAENKPLSSNDVEITPYEHLPLLDGEITENTETLESQSQNKDGVAYTGKVYNTNTIKAKWLPIAGGNRVSAPDVRRGAVVMIYRMGDENRYYWTTFTNDLKIRKLETVIYAWSATQDESIDTIDGENYYFLEISSHTKSVTFHTSKANGEPYSYDIQINTQDGRIIITDDIGNYLLLDSKEKQIKVENTDGSMLEIIGKDGIFRFPGNWTIDVGGTIHTKASSHHQDIPSVFQDGSLTVADSVTSPQLHGTADEARRLV